MERYDEQDLLVALALALVSLGKTCQNRIEYSILSPDILEESPISSRGSLHHSSPSCKLTSRQLLESTSRLMAACETELRLSLGFQNHSQLTPLLLTALIPQSGSLSSHSLFSHSLLSSF